MIKVGITQGDINGIGYEVILKTFADIRMAEMCIPVLYGSAKVAAFHRKAMELQPVSFNQINNAKDAVANKVNIVNCISEDTKIELGQSTPVAGEAAFQSLEKAVADLKNGVIDVLVTAPINKHNIQREDFHFPGHTEYLEERFGKEGDKSLMILVKDSLRVALVTGHMPLADVPKNLTKEKIIEAAVRFEKSLKRDFRIGRPRIAVLSLNPHAGENGLLGSEENDIIKPAIKELQDKKVLCFGPYPADGFFGSGEFSRFDGILAMYHDQGLAPFKTIAMEDGVNFTAGLSVVRTSPAHGTAYDIAGQNKASEESFRQAVYMAVDTFANRVEYDKAYADPLKKLYFERGGDNEVLDLTKDDE
ncbi:4-hydroxythreonine-4-phosphate dehydrogenase [Dysgonomonas sp. PFB1-18]|uniref:4-hydroxythreonine-4-phosphate dehydrogenase PdxA n=1 Tax=unclassified Dysgonomonas TaxID=2630389 RepID=UPI0024771279|nr:MULTISPECIES: 4-hydroxythreonine-4-phosphate dehydrogenase PdxA [unclassified Dysgonomonas]MDH6307498.1 4-hydroxythreonine-4-phosphate dehydrogenase [Dysgonomonas sp. PF1-14]MDH6337416.1 4-hydroxythreonine-4-phosphate dehydrogenase [Dysgonomonas sp. PF1-16]MDH6379340.1 4-hydroxythreonine-4-phosphate dehydrogenase [Dysgonomonas sp. PFB1-18]MDH6396022.1 4-hydroxythreonine-4-phosphate dehydrogenase [Dysgonomonas sp. PF1-23]